jgi:hypothetical protein
MSDPTVADRDPHFIGWLPMPRAFARVLTPFALVTVAVTMAVVWFVARGHPSPGPGSWDDDQPTVLEGVVYAKPYPMIRIPGSAAGEPPVSVLLVGEGKHGLSDRIQPFDGRPVRVAGTLLHRGDWRMLEVASTADSILPVEMPEHIVAILRRSKPVPLGVVELRGEIVDAKCYLGAMKPGNGVTHRGCALLCLKGGIPPLFVAREQDGKTIAYLPVNEGAGPLQAYLIELAGRSISASAELEQHDDKPVVRLAIKSVRID